MFELNLKREYNAYWVIGAINRALGDKWNEKRPYTCPKIISMSSEKIEIIIYEKHPYNEHEKSKKEKIVYRLSFSVSTSNIGENPLYVVSNQFTIDGIDKNLEQKVLEELK